MRNHGLPTQKQVEMMTESFSFHWNNIYLHAIALLMVDTITRVNTVLIPLPLPSVGPPLQSRKISSIDQTMQTVATVFVQ